MYGIYGSDLIKRDLADKPFSEEEFRQDLSEFGDSLLVISDDEVVKVHIHSEHPGDVFNLRSAIR